MFHLCKFSEAAQIDGFSQLVVHARNPLPVRCDGLQERKKVRFRDYCRGLSGRIPCASKLEVGGCWFQLKNGRKAIRGRYIQKGSVETPAHSRRRLPCKSECLIFSCAKPCYDRASSQQWVDSKEVRGWHLSPGDKYRFQFSSSVS